MNPWFAKAAVLLASMVLVVIRAPYGHRSRGIPVARSRKGRLEIALMTMMWTAFFLPLIWVATPFLAFADYALRPIPLVSGSLISALGLWLFYRSHVDLGNNWSVTLEVREQHRLVTQGLYGRVRHPMYLALILYGAGQALFLPNYLAGPAYGAGMVLMFALRLGPEERMMIEEFGGQYEDYAGRTKRVIPGVW